MTHLRTESCGYDVGIFYFRVYAEAFSGLRAQTLRYRSKSVIVDRILGVNYDTKYVVITVRLRSFEAIRRITVYIRTHRIPTIRYVITCAGTLGNKDHFNTARQGCKKRSVCAAWEANKWSDAFANCNEHDHLVVSKALRTLSLCLFTYIAVHVILWTVARDLHYLYIL